MAVYSSILAGVRRSPSPGTSPAESKAEANGASVEESEELSEKEEKEVEEVVEDILAIRAPAMLKRNLTNLARENIILKRKVEALKEAVAAGSKTGGSLSFQVDTEGGDAGDGAVPRYTDPALLLGQEPVPVPPSPKQSGNACFNCGAGHSMAECNEPRDQRRIAKARREWQNRMGAGPRYHIEEQQKFSHLKPGLPSAKLREALGLRHSDTAPAFLYRMRELGYPPGWLRQAEIADSGVAVYHEARQAEQQGVTAAPVKYDTSRLVGWPGFNTELPAGWRDEARRHGARQASRVQSLSEMKRQLGGEEDKEVITVVDMETEETEADSTAPPGTEDGELEEELERRRKEILAELEKTENDEKATAGEEKVAAPAPTPVIQQKTGSGTIAKTEDTGTPIVEMYSSVSSLPDYEKFGKDMSEHVAFENLPGATGNWDNMNEMLKQNRKRKSESVSEEEPSKKASKTE